MLRSLQLRFEFVLIFFKIVKFYNSLVANIWIMDRPLHWFLDCPSLLVYTIQHVSPTIVVYSRQHLFIILSLTRIRKIIGIFLFLAVYIKIRSMAILNHIIQIIFEHIYTNHFKLNITKEHIVIPLSVLVQSWSRSVMLRID